MSDKKKAVPSSKPSKGIPVSKIPTSGRDSGTHSRSSSVSNLTTASDTASEAGDTSSANTHGFKMEDRVWVNGTKPGYIKFLGKAEFAPGIWAGVILDEAVGKNDGTVAGVKYFTCEPMRGIFARPQKLTRSLQAGMGDFMGSTTSLKGAGSTLGSTASLRSAGLTTPTSSRICAAANTSPGSATKGVCSKLRLGERVAVSSTTGMKTGILRFIGETDFAKGEWAGIELDEPVGKNDGSVAGKRYFSCQMKYGLFSPIHKISRAGGTSTPRTPSVRSTPLVRSTSKDSLNSSASNCSKSSRVKLGVTSLTSSQVKKARTTGMGIMTTSRALEETLKEKEKQIEQLLKEHDIGRDEIAKLTSHCKEIEAQFIEFRNQQQPLEESKKELEQQLSNDKRKLEDIQFQLEEATIVKSDLEMQLKQKNGVFKRLEEFLNHTIDNKFVNIKEILEEKEVLSKESEIQETDGSQKLKDRISELETSLLKLTEEKEKNSKELEEAKSHFKEFEKNTEEQLFTLNCTIQEKEDMIGNLKNELNIHLEKLTNIVADNQALNEQMNLQVSAEKGHTEEVIKELGEQNKHLSEELKVKSDQIQEFQTSSQQKDAIISSLEDKLKSQSEQVSEAEDLNKSLSQSFKQKTIDLTENLALQHSLEKQIADLKLKIDTEIPEKEKKILDLVKQIEQLTNSVQEKEDDLAHKQADISTLKTELNGALTSQTDLKAKIEQLEENASLSSKDSTDKIFALEKEITQLKEENAKRKELFDKELQIREKKLEETCLELQNKVALLSEKESEIISIKESISAKEAEFSELQNKFTSATTSHDLLIQEKNITENNLREKIEELQKLQKEYESLSLELSSEKNSMSEKESELAILTEKLKVKESEFSELQKTLIAANSVSETLQKEKELTVEVLKDKEKLISDLEKQFFDANTSFEVKSSEASEYVKEIESLKTLTKAREEEIAQLASKLELAEQKVEMLNKDSSEHVMTLQKELSKLKEEADKVKGTLEQTVEQSIAKISQLEELLKSSKSELAAKENAIASLKKVVLEKDSQFDEFSKTIEASQAQLKKLNESNEHNVKMLENKEMFINEFRTEMEKKLKETEETVEQSAAKISQLEELHESSKSELAVKENDIVSLKKLMLEKDSQFDELSKMIEASQAQLLKSNENNKHNVKMLENKEMFINEFKTEMETKLKEREKTVEQSTAKISKLEELLERSKSELAAKENEIVSLKKVVLEKDSQFDELSKMIEASQAQLKKLNENNEHNVKMLENKEIFINEFKAEMEKKLKEREESFKSEISNLEGILHGKEEIAIQKEEIISKLNAHTQEQDKQIALLRTNLKETDELKEKSQQISNKNLKEFTDKIADLEAKYLKLMDEKEKIASEELKTRNDKKNLEEMRDALLQEKVHQEEVVKDREAKLADLQAEVNRMQTEFTRHKQELEQKLDVSSMEKEAASELKKHLELQHSVLEELQEDLNKSEEKCKKLEFECENLNGLKLEKEELAKKITESEQIIAEKSLKISDIEDRKQAAEELLINSQNTLLVKEKECLALKEQVQNLVKEVESKEQLKSSVKALEEENKLLKLKAELMPSTPDKFSSKSAAETSNQMDTEERDSLLSQIDFLNSIIVDMKQKNEELHNEIEASNNYIEEDLNLNQVKKIPPRLFCDICDMFDLHDTDDCPKQESYIDDDETPNLVLQGVRKLEERPYCNNCEVFGHWTLDCKEEEEY